MKISFPAVGLSSALLFSGGASLLLSFGALVNAQLNCNIRGKNGCAGERTACKGDRGKNLKCRTKKLHCKVRGTKKERWGCIATEECLPDANNNKWSQCSIREHSASPTDTPSNSPTAAPTEAPTNGPSSTPSTSPTDAPSASPITSLPTCVNGMRDNLSSQDTWTVQQFNGGDYVTAPGYPASTTLCGDYATWGHAIIEHLASNSCGIPVPDIATCAAIGEAYRAAYGPQAARGAVFHGGSTGRCDLQYDQGFEFDQHTSMTVNGQTYTACRTFDGKTNNLSPDAAASCQGHDDWGITILFDGCKQ